MFGNFSLFKTPFPRRNSVPPSFVSFFVFYIFSYLRSKTMGCFSGCLMSSAGIQKMFCGIYSSFKCSFDKFEGEKVFSPSYSSAILAPPPALIFLTDSFPTSDFDFTCLFNFVHLSFHCIPSHASQQCLSICPSNSCHLIACATYILANMSKPIRMSKPAHLENFFDKPYPYSDSYTLHNVTEQSEHSPMHLAIDVFHFNPPCS